MSKPSIETFYNPRAHTETLVGTVSDPFEVEPMYASLSAMTQPPYAGIRREAHVRLSEEGLNAVVGALAFRLGVTPDDLLIALEYLLHAPETKDFMIAKRGMKRMLK